MNNYQTSDHDNTSYFCLMCSVQTNVSHSSQGSLKHINIQMIIPLIRGQEILALLLQTLQGFSTNDQK